MNVERILMAAELAANAHAGQMRKYTGDPYIIHPLSVARIVAGTKDATEDMVIAAVLHDVVEDTKFTGDQIAVMFGSAVAQLVDECTEVSTPADGLRAERKELDRRHFSQASPQGQTIKLADLLDNGRTILMHDKNFSTVFLREKQELLRSMTRGDPRLYHDALRMVSEHYKGAAIKEKTV